MDTYQKRSRLIIKTIQEIQNILAAGADVANLNRAKVPLGALASQTELFPPSEFPWPSPQTNNHMYCVYRGEDNKMALYVDVLLRGESNAPHDHGNSWAMVAGIRGQEKHHLYERVDGVTGPGPAKIKESADITIGPGDCVSMLAGGIHSISTVGSDPVMMLHCYERAFEDQSARIEYDLTTGKCAFGTDATGEISNIALHKDAGSQA